MLSGLTEQKKKIFTINNGSFSKFYGADYLRQWKT